MVANTDTNISKIFRKTLDQNNTITKEQVKIIMNSKYNIDLTCNKKKNKWYLIFDKKTLMMCSQCGNEELVTLIILKFFI